MELPEINQAEVSNEMEGNAVPAQDTAAESHPATGGSPSVGCTGDCRQCHPYQRAYCSAQLGYNLQTMVATLSARLDEFSKVLENISTTCDEISLALAKSQDASTLFEPAAASSKRTRKTKENKE